MKKMMFLFAMIISFQLSVFAYKTEKIVEKSFDANSITNLYFSNKYGDVELIEDANAKEISFNYLITVECGNEELYKARMESINIKFSQELDMLKAETEVKDLPKSINSRNEMMNFNIRATVRIPKKIYSEFFVKYGNFVTDKLSQNFKGHVKYGNVNINELNGSENLIELKYGNIKLVKATSLHFEVGYSGSVEIGTMKKAKIESKYSSLFIESVDDLSIVSKFDKYRIGNVKKMETEMSYTGCDIKQLQTLFKTNNCKYCHVKINDIDASFEKIDVSAAYTPVVLNLKEKNNCRVTVYTSYGSIKKSQGLVTKVISQDENHLIAMIGKKEDPKSEIIVNVSYGSVSLKE